MMFLPALRVFLVLVVCEGIEALAPRAANSTSLASSHLSSSSSITKSSSSSSVLSSVTKTTSTVSTTSSSVPTTITAAPTLSTSTYAWGNQSIVLNTCSFVAPGGNIEYEPCSVQVGSIKLSYFPEPNGNVTYPKTHYVPEWDITMTSPSIYMLMNTITGFNDCGPLGPTFVNKVISMLITDVSTLPPYADSTTHDRISTQERQLTLSDLLNCPSYSTVPEGYSTNQHPVSDTYGRCNPFIKLPEEASAIGYPYWVHCAPVSYRMGVWDPPGSVPPVNGLFPSTTSDTSYTSTQDPPTAVTAIETLPSSTPIAETTPTPSAVVPVESSLSPSPVSIIEPSSTTPAIGGDSQSTASPVLVSSTPSVQGAAPSPVPASSSVIPAIASPTTSVPGPAAGVVTSPTVIATIGGQIVSAVQGASTVQIGTQVVTAGGAEVTLSGGNVATLGPSGSLLIKSPSGTTSVYVITTAAPVDTELAGATWVTNAGSSAIVVGTQIASIGGPAITLSNHDVVSLGSSGLNVQMPGGTISTLVPSPNIASIIAAIVGASQATTSAVSSSATSQGLVAGSVSAQSMSVSTVLATAASSSGSSHTAASSTASLKKSESIVSSSHTTAGSSSSKISSRLSSSVSSSHATAGSSTSSKKVVSSSSGSSGTSPITTSKAAGVIGSVSTGTSSTVPSTQPASKASGAAAATFTGAGCRMIATLGIRVTALLCLVLGLVL